MLAKALMLGRFRNPAIRSAAPAVLLSIVLMTPAAFSRDGGQDAGAVPDLDALQRAFQQIADRVSPSVVGVRVRRRYVTPTPRGADDKSATGLFEQVVIVNGSGTIVRADGMILTNEHVVQSAIDIEVLFHDGRRAKAELFAADARGDLAILRVDRKDLKPAAFCDWSAVRRGQWNIAVGNPYGLGRDGKLSVAVGVISNLGRRLPGLGAVDDRLYANMIQTTAPINPGNSGGPLFNIRGELLGVVTAMHTRAAADDGVGFAIPITPAKKRLINRLLNGKPIEYGYVGLRVAAPDAEQRQAAGIEPDAGAAVTRVEPGGPADLAGLRVGDLVIRYNDQVVRNASHLVEMVGETSIGAVAPLEIVRDTRRMTIRVTVARREVSRVGWMRGGAVEWRGLRLANMTADARRRMKISGGATGVVVIDVRADSPASRARLRIGDVIEQIEGARVNGIAAFQREVRPRNGAVKVSVRDRGTLTVAP